jgi:hypothetical protein
MSNRWIQECIHNLHALQGRTIEQVIIWEMALLDAGHDGKPVFDHPACPFLQAWVLYLRLPPDDAVKILTYQNDDWFGLYAAPVSTEAELVPDESDADSIFRKRELLTFPQGEITAVSIHQNEAEDISEVTLVIGQHTVLLKAGEVDERWDGSIYVRRDDESVLIFLDPRDVERITFHP